MAKRTAAPPAASSRMDPDRTARGAFVLDSRLPAGDGEWHSHRRAQLIHASEGVVTVRTEAGLWVVPPQRAVWILPGERHQVSSRSGYRLRTLYLEPRFLALPKQCCVVAVDRLMNELLTAASAFGHRYEERSPESRLVRVILDRLPQLSVTPLHLPVPADERLARMVAWLNQNPGDGRTLAALSRASGLTERTAARLFVQSTGLTFGEWRRQLRLLAALERLGMGESVSSVALEVGYEDVSSFISVFKAALGTTPARYFRAAPDGQGSPGPASL